MQAHARPHSPTLTHAQIYMTFLISENVSVFVQCTLEYYLDVLDGHVNSAVLKICDQM